MRIRGVCVQVGSLRSARSERILRIAIQSTHNVINYHNIRFDKLPAATVAHNYCYSDGFVL